MCGRLNVTDDPLVQWICDHLGIAFATNFFASPEPEPIVLEETV